MLNESALKTAGALGIMRFVSCYASYFAFTNFAREFYVFQCCMVIHSTANRHIGRPDNSLINRPLYFTILDF
jgi:hypothetical protein